MTYSESTQFKNWTFSKSDFLKLRQRVNEATRANLISSKSLEVCTMFITPEEEEKVINAFIITMVKFFKKFRPTLPNEVYGTSVTYLRRFFTKHSVMDFHPREIFTVCMYIAIKVCEISVTLDNFLRNIPNNTENYKTLIHQSECFVLTELNFDLKVNTPYNYFKSLLLDVRNIRIKMLLKDVEDENRYRVEEKRIVVDEMEIMKFEDYLCRGNDKINLWYASDVMMMFDPCDVALTVVGSVLELEDVNLCWSSLVSQEENRRGFSSELVQRQILASSGEADLATVEELCEFEVRLDRLRNPRYNPQSEEYLRLKADYDSKHSLF